MTWSHSDSGTFQDRWDETAARVLQAGGPVSYPATEQSLFHMRKWLEGRQPKQTWSPPSAGLKAADDELLRAMQLYDNLVQRIGDEQKLLRRPHVQQKAAALGLVIDEALTAAPASREQMFFSLFGVHAHLRFDTVEETRAAIPRVLARVMPCRTASSGSRVSVGSTVNPSMSSGWCSQRRAGFPP